jgi:hypothetical protein
MAKAPVAGTCPLGGAWYVSLCLYFCNTNDSCRYECYTIVPSFQGCCRSNPCQNNGCPSVNLTAAGIPAEGTAATNQPNVKCPSTSLFYTCLDTTPGGSFQGCCKSNPCSLTGCPVGDLESAQFKTSTPRPTVSATSTSNTATVVPISNNITASHTNNTPIIAGVVVGGVVLIALIGFSFWYLRGRKRKNRNSKDPSSMAMMRENKVPDNAVNADNGKSHTLSFYSSKN